MKKAIACFMMALLIGCAVIEDSNPSLLKKQSPDTAYWRPRESWFGFNLLGMFCKTKMENGDKRIHGYFPEDHFIWLQDWGFNFVRLPLDYRFFVEDDDWMKIKESQLKKLDDAVAYGKKHNIHVQINFHRAPGYCCNPPEEPQSLFKDKEPLVAFTNLWSTLAKRYKGIPNEELSFDLVNEPAPVRPYGATPSNYAAVARSAFVAIRAVDKDRFIMSDGWEWGNKPVMELHPFDGASGESIHCYSPHSVTHYKVLNRKYPKACPPWPPAGYTNGLEWLEKNYVSAWKKAIDDGTFLFVGEFGCYQPTVPHVTFLAWLEDSLKMCDKHGWGWALWNVDGKFGIMDNGRSDCEMEDFNGHKLDRKALNLLIKYAQRGKRE
ncbi:MAG: cellulase family glycosylhydrolase [Kiritimatiellae bacterium]|nr:cellulase family glycosylhydrolase [Kiritimatiellia bacterium]